MLSRRAAWLVGVLPLIGFGVHGTILVNAAWQKARIERQVYRQKLARSAPEAARRFVTRRLSEVHPEWKKQKGYPTFSPVFGPAFTVTKEDRWGFWQVSGTVTVMKHGKAAMLYWRTDQYFDKEGGKWVPMEVQGVYY